MSRAEFVKQASVICSQRAAMIVAVGNERHTLIESVRIALPRLKDSVNRLSALRPPAELKAAYADVMARERRQVVIAEEALRTGRFAADAVDHDGVLHRRENERAMLGMRACD